MTTGRRRGRAGLGAVGAIATLATAGCQDTFELRVENRCGEVVEVAVETLPPAQIPDGFEPVYDAIDPLQTTDVGDVGTRTTDATVWVRADATGEPVMFSVALDDLDPGRSDDDDVTIPIDGDHCPA